MEKPRVTHGTLDVTTGSGPLAEMAPSEPGRPEAVLLPDHARPLAVYIHIQSVVEESTEKD